MEKTVTYFAIMGEESPIFITTDLAFLLGHVEEILTESEDFDTDVEIVQRTVTESEFDEFIKDFERVV